MKQQLSVLLAAALFAATPALAADQTPGQIPNCDFEPACEVAPGVYGALNAPATSKFNLSIGGFVKLDYAYNSGNYGPNGFYTGTRAPQNSTAEARKDQSTFSARSSRIWFKSNGPTLLNAKTSALLELDFTNSAVAGAVAANNTESFAATPRLRHAWANLDWGTTQLLFGQTTDNLSIFNANTVDFNAGTQAGYGNGARIPQLRLTQRVDFNKENALKFVLAAQQPYQTNFNSTGTAIKAGDAAGAAGDSWGAVPLFVGQAFFISKALGTSPTNGGFGQQSFTAGFFGAYGNQNATGQRFDHSIDSWLSGFYTFIPVLASKDGKSRAKTLTFEAQTFLAANLNGYTAAQYTGTNATNGPAAIPATLTSNFVPANPTNGTNANLTGAKGFGYAGHLLFYPTDQLSINAGFGRRQAYSYDSYKNIARYERYNQTYFVNVFYDLNAAVRVATEYQRLDTRYAGSATTTSAAKYGDVNSARVALYYFF